MVIHKKRASPYGNGSPRHTLLEMTVNHIRNRFLDAKVGPKAHNPTGCAKRNMDKPELLHVVIEEPQREEGAFRTRHLKRPA